MGRPIAPAVAIGLLAGGLSWLAPRRHGLRLALAGSIPGLLLSRVPR